MLPLVLHYTLSQFPLSPPLSAADLHQGPALCLFLPGWCSWLVFYLFIYFLRGLYTHTFNNTDGLRHQLLIDIEPAFPPEHLPLTLEGMTQMHFIFRSIIESAPSLKWLHYLFCRSPWFVCPPARLHIIPRGEAGLSEHEVRSHGLPSRGEKYWHVFGYLGALQTTRLLAW